jgi:hypothetical protein
MQQEAHKVGVMPLWHNKWRFENLELQGASSNYHNEESWLTNTACPMHGKTFVNAEPAVANNCSKLLLFTEMYE